jgi:alpha-tubulin suppressor-like RCC1 family protein
MRSPRKMLRLLPVVPLIMACNMDIFGPDDSFWEVLDCPGCWFAPAVTITPPQPAIAVGDSVRLTATIAGTSAPQASFTWRSDDEGVATVDSTGLVIGHRPGRAAVWATRGDSIGLAEVEVALGTATAPYAPGFVSLALGDGRSCALDANGALFCWGYRLVDETRSGPTGIERWTATRVAGAGPFRQVVHGRNHICGLDAVGAASCVGANRDGQLGNGTREPAEVPAPVATGERFDRLYASADGTCGITVEGRLACWGANYGGELATGDQSPVLRPRVVAGGRSFTAVTLGPIHACALDADGRAFCWGSNVNGELGNGTREPSLSPVAVDQGTARFTSLVIGGQQSCALDRDGTAWCWGATFQNEARVRPAAVTAPERLVSIAAGNAHACALGASGRAYCWGSNLFGQLGDGFSAGWPEPRATAGSLAFVSIAAGWQRTCAITAAGETWCWGDNLFGGLGDGTRVARDGPVRVAGE